MHKERLAVASVPTCNVRKTPKLIFDGDICRKYTKKNLPTKTHKKSTFFAFHVGFSLALSYFLKLEKYNLI